MFLILEQTSFWMNFFIRGSSQSFPLINGEKYGFVPVLLKNLSGFGSFAGYKYHNAASQVLKIIKSLLNKTEKKKNQTS